MAEPAATDGLPAVSIITPSLNQGRFIERTIQSVLGQDLGGRSLEYFVVDGASRDDTLGILQRYADRLRWISEPDHGHPEAVNKGLRLTRGQIIGWLNSDDVYYPGAISAACDFLDAHPEVDVVYGDANHIDEQGNVLDRYPTEPFDLDRLIETCYICQPAAFFRRRVVERFGLLDEELPVALDHEYWLRLARGGATFAYLPRTLAAWRLYPGIKSYARRLQLHHETNDMLRAMLGRVPDRWLYNYAHARLEQTSIDSRQHLRFAIGLTLWTVWASLRWNRAVAPSVRATTLIWLKDGVKLFGWSMRAGLRARLARLAGLE
jgi:glycosyltransferase involved in cell wall biosynthesis